MGSRSTGTLGRRAEDQALQYLADAGLRLLSRNFRRRGGEIDLVMIDGDCLVFVEVRFRHTAGFAHPGLTVDRRKQRKITRTAALFLAANARLARLAVRFDVVAIVGDGTDGIEWIRDAFRPDDASL